MNTHHSHIHYTSDITSIHVVAHAAKTSCLAHHTKKLFFFTLIMVVKSVLFSLSLSLLSLSPAGDYSASFDIFISADTVPELAELFNVQLLTVNELNQALSDAHVCMSKHLAIIITLPLSPFVSLPLHKQLIVADVTIAKNDKPEGTFVIADVSKGPLFVNVSNK